MYSNKNGEMGIYIISMIDGKFVKKIISGNKTSEFEELHILKPGISWSSDGNKIVFAAKSGKSDALFIFDLNDSSKNLKKVFNFKVFLDPHGILSIIKLHLSVIMGCQAIYTFIILMKIH